jgi:hypothetical protein
LRDWCTFFLDGACYLEFAQWSAVHRQDSNVDSRRIQSLESGLYSLSEWLVDPSGFEGGYAISVSGTGSPHLFNPMDETAKFG